MGESRELGEFQAFLFVKKIIIHQQGTRWSVKGMGIDGDKEEIGVIGYVGSKKRREAS